MAFAGLACLNSALFGQMTEDLPRIIDSSRTLTADTTWILPSYVFVVTPEGAAQPTTLKIMPGTVIKGVGNDTTSSGEVGALVITRGARIEALGTAEDPIIFTATLDELDGTLGPADVKLWGGVLVMGSAPINSRADSQIVAAPVQDQIEGFELPESELHLITFGGTDEDDNSGVIRYISIRHGGNEIGSDNEINGLTLGGVGRGTLIEYVEVFANKDDGVEWFGGTVDARYHAVAFSYDDSFDYDQGWTGRGQFWFTIGGDAGSDLSDKGGEHDGSTQPLDSTPFGGTRVHNATYIGIGNDGRDNTALNIRDNAKAQYYNSIFVDYAKMLDIEADNYERLQAGEVDFRNNIFWSHVAENNTPAGLSNPRSGNSVAGNAVDIDPSFFFSETERMNQIIDPLLLSISRTADGGLNPLPAPHSPAWEASTVFPEDEWYHPTFYLGAFSPSYLWIANWTKLATEGYLASAPTYIESASLGMLYSYTGTIAANQWYFSKNTGSFVYLLDVDYEGYVIFHEFGYSGIESLGNGSYDFPGLGVVQSNASDGSIGSETWVKLDNGQDAYIYSIAGYGAFTSVSKYAGW